MVQYQIKSIYEGNNIRRENSGTAIVDGREVPYVEPWFGEVEKITAQHDALHKSNPKRKIITTIVEEE